MRTRVSTSAGPAVIELDRPAGSPRALLVLTHGAGGGVEAPDLCAVRDAALSAGFAVARVTQAYRVAGLRAPARADTQDESWRAVIASLRRRTGLRGLPLVVGGRSNGARVACRTAAATRADAVVALAFPLHPPGRPELSRLAELEAAGVPVLVVQGDRDPFGVPPPAAERAVKIVAGADHALRRDLAGTAAAVLAFVESTISR